MTDAAAIVLAAGSGDRLGSEVPKAFVPLGSIPIVVRAVRAMRAAHGIGAIVVAVPSGWEARGEALLASEACTVLSGGPTRRESVVRALDAVETERVVCHDAARALAPASLVERVLAALDDPSIDGSVPGLPVVDTVKRVEAGLVVRTEPREGLVAVQTPQAFRTEALRAAHARVSDAVAITDDAMAIEAAGGRVRVVPGDPLAFKITTAEDLALAEAALAREAAIRG